MPRQVCTGLPNAQAAQAPILAGGTARAHCARTHICVHVVGPAGGRPTQWSWPLVLSARAGQRRHSRRADVLHRRRKPPQYSKHTPREVARWHALPRARARAWQPARGVQARGVEALLPRVRCARSQAGPAAQVSTAVQCRRTTTRAHGRAYIAPAQGAAATARRYRARARSPQPCGPQPHPTAPREVPRARRRAGARLRARVSYIAHCRSNGNGYAAAA
jgi:hypothetical protein